MVQRVTQRMSNDELSHEQLPPLGPGDRLTRLEFERRPPPPGVPQGAPVLPGATPALTGHGQNVTVRVCQNRNKAVVQCNAFVGRQRLRVGTQSMDNVC
jgi:hypothetical protein